MVSRIKLFVVAALACVAVAPGTIAHAERPKKEFAEKHPRRAEVNGRIKNQRRLLDKQLKEGKITKDQYQAQMKELNATKSEERADVKANGGSLTKDQQKALNQDLNNSRKEIKANNGDAAPQSPAK